MLYEIIQKFLSFNRSGKVLNASGTTVHETADPGATDENEFNYYNGAYRGASAHAFVDRDSITQNIPWNEQAWHAGPTANSKFIGIELCHYDDEASFNEVWKRAVWLFAYVHINILKITTITKDNLMSHAEISDKWHETNHVDPIAYFAEFGKTVDDFRAAVQLEINNQLKPPVVNNDNLKLQQTLNRLKIKDGKGNALIEDNIIGNCTKEAIKRFQYICGLTADGEVGSQTQAAINTILAKPLLKVGINGIATRYLQFRVGVTYDGIFGNITKAAVVKYQGLNKLSADGIVGNMTWTKLIG